MPKSDWKYGMSGPVPKVSPEDIKGIWPLVASLEADAGIDSKLFAERCSPDANVQAVFVRTSLIRALLQQGLLDKWREGDHLHDKVFELAATRQVVPTQEFGYDFADLVRALK
jgi:hypothetical protein